MKCKESQSLVKRLTCCQPTDPVTEVPTEEEDPRMQRNVQW